MYQYHPPADSTLNIHYLDDDLLVVDKPAGLLAVPGRGDDKQDCLLSRLQLLYPDVLVVHRLDMATSGLMMLARNTEIQRLLSILFAERNINKRYVAIVEGLVETAEGEINLPLITDWPNRPKQKVDYETGKPSITRYRVLEQVDNTTRLELVPVTGRSHQLRLHMQSIGHPIIGDCLYGSSSKNEHDQRLLLHACHLQFCHPRTRNTLSINSNTPF